MRHVLSLIDPWNWAAIGLLVVGSGLAGLFVIVERWKNMNALADLSRTDHRPAHAAWGDTGPLGYRLAVSPDFTGPLDPSDVVPLAYVRHFERKP